MERYLKRRFCLWGMAVLLLTGIAAMLILRLDGASPRAIACMGAVIAALAVLLLLFAKIPAGISAKRLSDAAAALDDSEIYEIRSLCGRIRSQTEEIATLSGRVENEKNRLSTILDNMDEGLIILDDELRVIMLNESAWSWLGTSIDRADCAGRKMQEICESREICDCIERADSVNLTLFGRDLQVHVNHVGSSAEQIGRIGLLMDVTERAEIERIKQEFTANVSHELKTPLTSISGYAELIESGMAQGQDSLLFAGRIRRESTRMLSLISDIIKLSKLDEAADDVELEPCELHQTCVSCMDLLDMSAKRHEVTLSLEGGRCELIGSANQLSELVYNLIDNGIRYNRPGGKVRIRADKNPAEFPGAVAMLTVSDTGIGISKEHQTRVFERFYRVDKSRSKETGGTGLGLAIVKHVAERHRAKILLESKLGEGTTIRVVFYENEPEFDSDKNM